ncbi:hypothetical protein ACOSQ2_026801 [Xanthoceras sorbifolium]
MVWVVMRNKVMGLRRSELACLSLLLLLLILSQLETSCCADHVNGYSRFSRFKGGSGSHHLPVSSYGGLKGNNNVDKNGDQIFGAEKRKVYTGPNPLHNR